MTSRSSHSFQKGTCNDVNCCNNGKTFFADGGVDTRINVYKGRTSNSCVFYTPGGMGSQFNDFYQAGGTTPNPVAFFTHAAHPVATDLLVTPAHLPNAAVFLFTSFSTTDLHGNTKNHLSSHQIVSVEQPGAGTSLPNRITDTPRPVLGTNYMFGSFDKVLGQILSKSGSKFQTLTNPNEIFWGSPNRIQIIWPEGHEWQVSFVGPEEHAPGQSRLYTYSSNPAQLSYIVIDQAFNQIGDTTTIVGSSSCSVFAVFDEPTGYTTCRQPFDMTWPPFPPVCLGVTGVTSDIDSGQACVMSFTINNNQLTVPTSCLCMKIENEAVDPAFPIAPRVNGTRLVELLNMLFYKTKQKGWLAIEDTFYPYFRIVHPNNIMQYMIQLKKVFYKIDGTRNSCFDELQNYSQGALSEFIKNDPITGAPITTNNSVEIMDGISWCAATDKNGCFTI